MEKIKIIADSSSDITIQDAQALDIRVLGFSVLIDGKEYIEGKNISSEEFYRITEKSDEVPHTSQIKVHEFEEVYKQYLDEGYTDIIYVSISSTGSSTFSNAQNAKENFYAAYPDVKGKFGIHIIDSLNYTAAIGYPVMQAAKKVIGGATLREVTDYLLEWFECTELYFAPYNLKYVRKSGRLSAAAAFAGEVLGLKPIISMIDGVSGVNGKVRGERNIVPKLLEIAQSKMIPKTPYCILYGSHPENAETLEKEFTAKLGYPPEWVCRIGITITCHAGANVAGVVFRGEKRR